MKYLSTKMATDIPEKESWKVKLLRTLLFFVPTANPDYEGKWHLVKTWLIEFTEEEEGLLPWREIGLDKDNFPVLAGPDKRNYGFWLDSHMKLEDFDGEFIEKAEFERIWEMSGVKNLETD